MNNAKATFGKNLEVVLGVSSLRENVRRNSSLDDLESVRDVMSGVKSRLLQFLSDGCLDQDFILEATSDSDVLNRFEPNKVSNGFMPNKRMIRLRSFRENIRYDELGVIFYQILRLLLIDLNVDRSFTMISRFICELNNQYLSRFYCTKLEDISQGYWDRFEERNKVNNRFYRLTHKRKQAKFEQIHLEQIRSLSVWISICERYSLSEEIRVWILEGLFYLGSFNHVKRKFSKRGKSTVNPFPECKSEWVLLAVEFVSAVFNLEANLDSVYEKCPTLKTLRNKKNIRFDAVYNAIAVDKYQEIDFDVIDGKWKVVEQGDYQRLQAVADGTGWCIADELPARSTIAYGPFHYYEVAGQTRVGLATKQNGRFLEERELRGVAEGQTIDGKIDEAGLVKDKLCELNIMSTSSRLDESIVMLDSFMSYIHDPFDLLSLLSVRCEREAMPMDGEDYDIDHLQECQGKLFRYIERHPEYIENILAEADNLSNCGEVFGTLDWSFYDFSLEELKQLSKIPAQGFYVGVEGVVDLRDVAENIVVLRGSVEELVLDSQMSELQIDALGNDMILCKKLIYRHEDASLLDFFKMNLSVQHLVLDGVHDMYKMPFIFTDNFKQDTRLELINCSGVTELCSFLQDSFISLANLDHLILSNCNFKDGFHMTIDDLTFEVRDCRMGFVDFTPSTSSGDCLIQNSQIGDSCIQASNINIYDSHFTKLALNGTTLLTNVNVGRLVMFDLDQLKTVNTIASVFVSNDVLLQQVGLSIGEQQLAECDLDTFHILSFGMSIDEDSVDACSVEDVDSVLSIKNQLVPEKPFPFPMRYENCKFGAKISGVIVDWFSYLNLKSRSSAISLVDSQIQQIQDFAITKFPMKKVVLSNLQEAGVIDCSNCEILDVDFSRLVDFQTFDCSGSTIDELTISGSALSQGLFEGVSIRRLTINVSPADSHVNFGSLEDFNIGECRVFVDTKRAVSISDVEFEKLNLSSLSSLNGISFERIYADRLVLSGLTTLEGFKQAFESFEGLDDESDYGFGELILPRSFKGLDIKVPEVIEEVVYKG